MMKQCFDRAELFRDPAGRWLATRSGLLWCHSPTLCGAVIWGRPGLAEARELLAAFEGYRYLAAQFDVVQDVTALEGIDGDALAALITWTQQRESDLRDRLRRRIGVIAPGIEGLALAGVAPAFALDVPFTIVDDARQGFDVLLPDGGRALHDEIVQLVASARGVAPVIVELRRVLAETRGDLKLAAAARQLAISSRSLQRELTNAGLSFRTEQTHARLRAAESLLRSDRKLSAVAAEVGMSEDAFIVFAKSHLGITPTEWRRRLAARGH